MTHLKVMKEVVASLLTCKNLMSLQTTIPASQEMVIFQMMSVRTLMRPTQRSAAARCLMKKFIRDLRPLAVIRAISTVELPRKKEFITYTSKLQQKGNPTKKCLIEFLNVDEVSLRCSFFKNDLKGLTQ